jgi:hypothetical protein
VYFKKISEMKINYHKSDLTSISLDEDESNLYAQIFCYKLGQFPFTYLGVPLHYEKLRREDIQPIVDKIMKRISRWKGKLMSYGARLALLKACLASIPIYLISIVKFPKWAIKAINFQIAKFFEMMRMINIGITYPMFSPCVRRRIRGAWGSPTLEI